ncbi:MAG: methylmalonyl-CoA epimerase [Deltaproteobacteria bacterium]|jgi:methylmalonyl-CoA/ethylmalonyl-CoA epimerase
MTTFKLDHVAVAVRDIDDAVGNFEKKLGLSCERVEEVPTQKAKVAFFDVGGAHLELVAPTEDASSVARSIDKRGEGLHHICLEVEDIDAALALARMAGIRLVNEAPVPGAGGSRVAFLHPKSLNGVLVELVEKRPGSADAHGEK